MIFFKKDRGLGKKPVDGTLKCPTCGTEGKEIKWLEKIGLEVSRWRCMNCGLYIHYNRREVYNIDNKGKRIEQEE